MSSSPSEPSPMEERVMRVVSHCMEGRFKFGEGCRTTAAVLRSLLDTCDVLVGQCCHVSKKQHLDIPDHFNIIGDSMAFVAYDRERFKADEHVWSPQGRHDGEAWNCVVKLRCLEDPLVEFFVISWYVLDSSLNYADPKRSASLFKQLTQLLQLLSKEFPVIVGGNFQLNSEEANYLLKTFVSLKHENKCFFEALKCYSYDAKSLRRRMRACGFFMATHDLLSDPVTPSIENFLDGGGPVSPRSIRGNVVLNDSIDDLWRNPEDFFYWDPSCLRLKLDRISGVVRIISKAYGSLTSSSVTSSNVNTNNNNNNKSGKNNNNIVISNGDINNNKDTNDKSEMNNFGKDTDEDTIINDGNNTDTMNDTTNDTTNEDNNMDTTTNTMSNNSDHNNKTILYNTDNTFNNFNVNYNYNLHNNTNTTTSNNSEISDNNTTATTTPKTPNNPNNILNTNTSEYEFEDSEVDDYGHLKRSKMADMSDNKEDNYDLEEAYGRYLNIVKENKSDNKEAKNSLKQIEKLKELRGFVDSIEQKHDEDYLKAEIDDMKAEIVHHQQEMVSPKAEMVYLRPEVGGLKGEEEEMGKSLSTICEYDEHSNMSGESIADCGGGQDGGDDDGGDYDYEDDYGDGGGGDGKDGEYKEDYGGDDDYRDDDDDDKENIGRV